MLSVFISPQKAQALALDSTVRTWPGGYVYFSFSNDVSTAEQEAFLDAASEWAMFANLHFIPWTGQPNY